MTDRVASSNFLPSSSRSSHFHSIQDSLAGGIGSIVSKCKRLLFSSLVYNAIYKPDTTVFEVCKPKYVFEL